MKAAFIHQPGPPENITYGDRPTPEPSASEVLVRMKAVAVNPVDTYIRAGQVPMNLPLPFVIGRDVAGTVEKVGADVTAFKVGDRVWSNNQGIHGRQGTFSEFVSVPGNLLYPLPAEVDFVPMIALVHSGLTACLGLERAGGIRPGQVIFVNGGAGNVGRSVTQIAAGLGARVISTAGNEAGIQSCLADGAEACLDYHSALLDEKLNQLAPEGIDLYWDTAGKQDFAFALHHLRRRGKIIVMSGLKAQPVLPVAALYLKDISIHGFAISYATADEMKACAEKINALAVSGSLKAKVDSILPLSQAQIAHRILEFKETKISGKIVLVPEN